MYSFIPWLNVQRVAKEFLPGSWGARQVGTSFSLPTWRSYLVMAHGASELWGLSHPECSQLCYYFSGTFSGPGSGAFLVLDHFWSGGRVKINLFYFTVIIYCYCKRESPSQLLTSCIALSPSDLYQRLFPACRPPPCQHVLFFCVKPDHGIHLFKTCQSVAS